MLFDRRNHAGIVNAETLLCKRRSETRVEHDWVFTLECVDRHAAQFAFVDEPLCGIEPREIVQHSGQTRLACIDAVNLRENVGAPRNAHHVFVAVALSEMVANAPREDGEGQNGAPLLKSSPQRGKTGVIEVAFEISGPHNERVFIVVAIVALARRHSGESVFAIELLR